MLPGSCRPVRLLHPTSLFRLNERSRLAEASGARRFDEARHLAGELQANARAGETKAVLGKAEALHTTAELGGLRQLAAGCAVWRQGFYRDAHQRLSALQDLPCAAAVRLPAQLWPRCEAFKPLGDRPVSELLKSSQMP